MQSNSILPAATGVTGSPATCRRRAAHAVRKPEMSADGPLERRAAAGDLISRNARHSLMSASHRRSTRPGAQPCKDQHLPPVPALPTAFPARLVMDQIRVRRTIQSYSRLNARFSFSCARDVCLGVRRYCACFLRRRSLGQRRSWPAHLRPPCALLNYVSCGRLDCSPSPVPQRSKSVQIGPRPVVNLGGSRLRLEARVSAQTGVSRPWTSAGGAVASTAVNSSTIV